MSNSGSGDRARRPVVVELFSDGIRISRIVAPEWVTTVTKYRRHDATYRITTVEGPFVTPDSNYSLYRLHGVPDADPLWPAHRQRLTSVSP